MTNALAAWPEAPESTDVTDETPYAAGGSQLTNLKPDPDLLISAEELQKTIDRLLHGSEDDDERNWSVAVRLLAAHLYGLTFSEVSTVIGMKPESVRKVLHGEQKLQASRRDQIGRMLAVTTKLRRLLDDDAVGDWFRTPVPTLKNSTPLETVRKRQVEKIERVVDSYFDPSYA